MFSRSAHLADEAGGQRESFLSEGVLEDHRLLPGHLAMRAPQLLSLSARRQRARENKDRGLAGNGALNHCSLEGRITQDLSLAICSCCDLDAAMQMRRT